MSIVAVFYCSNCGCEFEEDWGGVGMAFASCCVDTRRPHACTEFLPYGYPEKPARGFGVASLKKAFERGPSPE